MSEGDFTQQWLVGNAVPAVLLLGLTIPLIVLVARAHGAALRAFDPRSPEAQLLRRTRTRWAWLAALGAVVALVVVLLVAAGIGVAVALTDPATDPDRMNLVVYLFVAGIAGLASIFFTPAAVLGPWRSRWSPPSCSPISDCAQRCGGSTVPTPPLRPPQPMPRWPAPESGRASWCWGSSGCCARSRRAG